MIECLSIIVQITDIEQSEWINKIKMLPDRSSDDLESFRQAFTECVLRTIKEGGLKEKQTFIVKVVIKLNNKFQFDTVDVVKQESEVQMRAGEHTEKWILFLAEIVTAYSKHVAEYVLYL